MSARKADRRMLEELLAGEARRRAGEPELPTPEELLAYHEGRLGPDEEARIGRCLVASPEAARRLLDLAELAAAATPSADGPEARVADAEREAAWQRLEPALDQETAGRPAAAAAPLPPPAMPRRGHLNRWFATMAVVFPWVALSLVLIRPPRPLLLANAVSIELRENTRGAPIELTLPAGGASPARFLLTAGESRCSVFDAVLVRAGDAPQSVEGLKPDDQGRLNFLLLDLSPGGYTVVLSGCEPRRELQRHRFNVLATGPGAD